MQAASQVPKGEELEELGHHLQAPLYLQEYNFGVSGETIIGRMYTVSPREGERYVLRLLLLHVTGAKSFVDMRTVDGEACSLFRQACSR